MLLTQNSIVFHFNLFIWHYTDPTASSESKCPRVLLDCLNDLIKVLDSDTSPYHQANQYTSPCKICKNDKEFARYLT